MRGFVDPVLEYDHVRRVTSCVKYRKWINFVGDLNLVFTSTRRSPMCTRPFIVSVLRFYVFLIFLICDAFSLHVILLDLITLTRLDRYYVL